MRDIKRRIGNISLGVLDAGAIAFAVLASYGLRFDGAIPDRFLGQIPLVVALTVAVKMGAVTVLGLYSRVWAYASLPEMFSLAAATGAGTVVIWFLDVVYFPFIIPRSVLVIEWVLSTAALGATRALLRLRADRAKARLSAGKRQGDGGAKRLLIIGAGDAGALVAREIRYSTSWTVVGFIDDDPGKQGKRIYGIPVLGDRSRIPEVVKRFRVSEILIAMPSVSRRIIREILEVCREVQVPVRTLPALHELIDGSVTINSIREVRIEDLLGREPVKVECAGIASYLRGKRVLVTGAGGSIGGELCRQVARYEPAELILLGHGENSIFMMDQELGRTRPTIKRHVIVADVRDREKVRRIFAKFRPEVVFHAAAHKHVPLMEANPDEAVTNNVLGTLHVIEASQLVGVERFVLISTDKAVRPANAMGASKRIAEMLVQVAARGELDRVLGAVVDLLIPGMVGSGGPAWGNAGVVPEGANASGVPGTETNGIRGKRPRFVAVRFGNVLGSRGSVVEIFKQQIAAGGPVTVTDPEMRRYFMTIPEAVQLVLQAGAIGQGGEIFVLDMGEPVRILDLARDMIRLSGFEPDVEIPIHFVGPRPGEKVLEALVDEDEVLEPTEHPKIMRIRNSGVDAAVVGQVLRHLVQAVQGGVSPEELKALLVSGANGDTPKREAGDFWSRAGCEGAGIIGKG